MAERQEPEVTILERCRTIAVVGLSPDPQRPSQRVSRYMQQHGYRVIPVNPQADGRILGEQAYPSLAVVPISIDLVTVFRRSEFTDEAIAGAIAVGARAVWLQKGIYNPRGLARAREAGLLATQNRCLRVEYHRWRRAQGGAARDERPASAPSL